MKIIKHLNSDKKPIKLNEHDNYFEIHVINDPDMTGIIPAPEVPITDSTTGTVTTSETIKFEKDKTYKQMKKTKEDV